MHRSRRLPSAVLAFLVSLPLAALEIPVDGRVRDSGGVGLAGVRVELRPILSLYEEGSMELDGRVLEPAARTVTGADGRFEIRAPGEGMWEVMVVGEGFVPQRFRLTPLTGAETLLPVKLRRDAGLRVRFKGPDGRPLAGARVVGRTWSAEEPGWQTVPRIGTSGPDGVARLPCSRDELLVLLATAPGFPVQEGPEARGPAEVSFRLSAGTPRRVEAPDGAILRDLQTSLVLGRGSIEVVTRGESWLLLETAGGVRVRFAVPSKEGPVRVEVPAPAPLQGRVIGTSGRQPVVGAWVWPRDDPGRFTRTDGQGTYRLEIAGLPRSIGLEAAAAGHLPEVVDALVPWPLEGIPPVALDSAVTQGWLKARESRVHVVLARGSAVAGRLVDGEGRPVPDAEVGIEPETGPALHTDIDPGRETDLRAVTGPDGRFAFADVPAGWCEMTIRRPGAVAERLPRFQVGEGGTPVDLGALRVDGAEILTARVADPEGRPVAGAEVWASSHSTFPEDQSRQERWPAAVSAISGPDGTFSLRASRWQPLVLTLCGPGFVSFGVSLPQFFPEEPLLLTAQPAASLSGRVTGPDGLPVSRHHVAANLIGEPAGQVLHDCDRGGWSETDEAGRFRISSLVPGLYTIDYRNRMTLAAGEPRETAIHSEERKQGASLSGRLLGADGLPVPGAVVNLESQEDHGSYFSSYRASSRTDADGNYRLVFPMPGLKIDPSSYGVTRHGRTLVMSLFTSEWKGPEVLEAEGRFDSTVERFPEPLASSDDVVELKFSDSTATGTITGRILGLAPEELARVKVMAHLTRWRSLWKVASVDPQGTYRLEGLQRDGWQIQAEAADRTLYETVHIPEGEARIIRDLVFEPVSEVTGQVVTSGHQPVAGAAVSLRHRTGELQIQRPAAGARTRSDGSFSIRLPEGEYEVTAAKEGFVPSSEVPWDVVRVEGGRGGSAYLRLLPAIVLRGRLLGLPPDEDDVKIEATLVDGKPGYKEPLQGKMDAEGRYSIPGLGPGTWKVEASYEIFGTGDRKATGRVAIPEDSTEASLDLEFGPSPPAPLPAAHSDPRERGGL